MQLPIVVPAPVVSEHAGVFRDLFDNQCQFRHFQHHLTGLIVLPNKSMANMARCILDSADKTNLSRTIGDACRQQGRAVLQKLLLFVHEQLSDDATADHVFALLFAKQRGMTLV